jgi:hypothetical protein
LKGWFDSISAIPLQWQDADLQGIREKRLMGFEPTTFCMASAQVGNSFGSVGPDFGLSQDA